MDSITRTALEKAKVLEGEKEHNFFEKIQNAHWFVQIVVALVVLYALFFKTTCKIDGTPAGCFTFWNKVWIIAIAVLLLWLFGKMKKETVNKKLSRLEGLHVLNYVIKDYLSKLGYSSSCSKIDIRWDRGCDWIEGEFAVYHYEINIIYPLGKKEKLLVRMESQDSEKTIAGNIISVQEMDHKLDGTESIVKEYLVSMKWAKALEKGFLRPAMQSDALNQGFGGGDFPK